MPVTEKTVFIKDVGMYDLDAYGFFTAFADHFQIDMTSFTMSDYDPTAQSLWAVWFKGKRIKKFNVDHLHKVIEKHAWFDPE